MTDRNKEASERRADLRQREKKVQMSHADVNVTPSRVRQLLRELQTHHVELEQQNEQLRDTQTQLSEAHDRFFDLYDFAPIGYLTLDKNGKILEANLTAATMLGVERPALLGTNFAKSVRRDSRDGWHSQLEAAFSGAQTKFVCELQMRGRDDSRLAVRLEGILFGSENNRRCQAALVDITEQKKAE